MDAPPSASAMATLAKLTSQSTQTLSLLLERQRLQTFESGPNGGSAHLSRITQNLQQLRIGIIELEEKEGGTEAVRLLKNQYERMRGMLGPDADAAGLSSLQQAPPTSLSQNEDRYTPSAPIPPPKSPSPPLPPLKDGPFAPYRDDPEAGYTDTDTMLQTQRQMMNDQDDHLDELSRSVGRQRDLSLQINGELDVHRGLLLELDHEVDGTDNRLSQARRKLDRVARGARENSSTVMIGLIILILLILIIIFKT